MTKIYEVRYCYPSSPYAEKYKLKNGGYLFFVDGKVKLVSEDEGEIKKEVNKYKSFGYYPTKFCYFNHRT